MGTVGKIVRPEQQALAWKRSVDKQLNEESQSGQLISPQPWPATPFGGASPPSSLWYIPVTSATFTGTQVSQPWIIGIDIITHTGLKVSVPWTTDSGTSGELRLTLPGAANSPTSPKTLAASSSGVAVFTWLHGWVPYVGSGLFVYIEARRTGGAGNVNVGYPQGGAILVGPKGAQVTG